MANQPNRARYRFLTFSADTRRKCVAEGWRTIGAGRGKAARKRLPLIQTGDRLVCYSVAEGKSPRGKRWFGVLEVLAPHDPERDVEQGHPYPHRIRVRPCVMLQDPIEGILNEEGEPSYSKVAAWTKSPKARGRSCTGCSRNEVRRSPDDSRLE